ncbi:10623_t:CDS:1, partial [Diversispora eburnea]
MDILKFLPIIIYASNNALEMEKLNMSCYIVLKTVKNLHDKIRDWGNSLTKYQAPNSSLKSISSMKQRLKKPKLQRVYSKVP